MCHIGNINVISDCIVFELVILQWLVWKKHFDWRIWTWYTLLGASFFLLLQSLVSMYLDFVLPCLVVWLHLQRLSLQNLYFMDINLTGTTLSPCCFYFFIFIFVWSCCFCLEVYSLFFLEGFAATMLEIVYETWVLQNRQYIILYRIQCFTFYV